ncbi:MAG TPA: class I SAM-dependent methyltransferase [Bacillota bacterium]|nr:class I SAM-dependent methyltransferase [Bacillota bacterium]
MIADSPELRSHVRRFLDVGLMLDPWLAGLDRERFTFDSQDLLSRAAEGLAATHWREPVITATLGDTPATPALGRKAVREILDSTAATIASGQLGRIRVNIGMAQEAVRRLEAFIRAVGFGAAVNVYLLVETAKNQGALVYYGEIPEGEFVSAIRHRPWVRESIDGELLRDLATGEMRIAVRDGRRVVTTTAKGKRAGRPARDILGETGYLTERLALIHMSNFSAIEDYDQIVSSVVPRETAWRRRFVEFAGIGRGQRVLDVGCGTGAQLTEGGLLETVGPEGHVTGLDPAVGMLERARRKVQGDLAGQVDFVIGKAERLPFPDGSFDAVLDVQVLHLTDLPQAAAEMARVARPGGIVAHAGSYRGDQRAPEWLRWWMQPAAKVAGRYGMDVAVAGLATGQVAQAFEAAGLVGVRSDRQRNESVFVNLEEAAYFLIRSQAWIQRVLEVIPWAARRDLLAEIVARGRDIEARTTLKERTVGFPSEYVCAEVPTGK